MTVSVQFFSFFRQLTGCAETRVELPDGATVADLFAKFPQLSAARGSTLIAIGMEFARWDTVLRADDVVSFMPPLQGGSDRSGCGDAAEQLELILTDQPIPESAAHSPPARPEGGGVVVFWGVVRDLENGERIRALEYTAYRDMAEHQFRKLIAEAKSRWPIQRLQIIHRLGEVAVGEASLLVRVETAHRAEAFAACQFLIDELKAKVPIWKRGVR